MQLAVHAHRPGRSVKPPLSSDARTAWLACSLDYGCEKEGRVGHLHHWPHHYAGCPHQLLMHGTPLILTRHTQCQWVWPTHATILHLVVLHAAPRQPSVGMLLGVCHALSKGPMLVACIQVARNARHKICIGIACIAKCPTTLQNMPATQPSRGAVYDNIRARQTQTRHQTDIRQTRRQDGTDRQDRRQDKSSKWLAS